MWKKPLFWKKKSKREAKCSSNWMTVLVKSRNKSMHYSEEMVMPFLKPSIAYVFRSTGIKIVSKTPNRQILMIKKNSKSLLNVTMKQQQLSNRCLLKWMPVKINLKNANECWQRLKQRRMRYEHSSKAQVKPMPNLTKHLVMQFQRLKKQKRQLLQHNQKLIEPLLRSNSLQLHLVKQKKKLRNHVLNLKKRMRNSKQ